MFFPMFAMFILTVVLAFAVVKARIASVKNGEMKISYFRLMSGEALPENVAKTTRSFNNQFEVPILFYVVCSLYIFWGVNSYFALTNAWLFVALRIVHSYIHLTYNHVLHRMLAFWFSLLCVMALWINLLLQKI